MTLEIVRVVGFATVQGGDRRGHMHEAVPPGGALVPELLAAANRHAANRDDAAALEVLGRVVVRALGPLVVATDLRAHALATGDELAIASGPRRVAYLALRGGIDTPIVLGGRGALLCAGIGAPLRTGDRVAALATEPELIADVAADVVDDPRAIQVIAGPDRDAFAADALAALCAEPYRVLAASDRVGTRLGGRALPRDPRYVETSRPMVRGAIEVPGDGHPIVLGPEHPTTGGYPIVAVIASADLGRFFAIRLGGAVRFAI